MGLWITQVDAFTDRPFAGNPAAVCVPPGPREPAWMQAVAREMNLAETAFLEPRAAGGESPLPPGVQARFHTRSGLLSADRRGAWIELNFPATPAEPAPPPPGLAHAPGRPAAHGALPVRGVIATSRAAAGGFDFVSRFFAPAAGIPEDPVTGSSHCALGPYWGARLGKTEMLAYQASARGGVVRVRLAGERVRLGGQAVTVLRGQLVQANFRGR